MPCKCFSPLLICLARSSYVAWSTSTKHHTVVSFIIYLVLSALLNFLQHGRHLSPLSDEGTIIRLSTLNIGIPLCLVSERSLAGRIYIYSFNPTLTFPLLSIINSSLDSASKFRCTSTISDPLVQVFSLSYDLRIFIKLVRGTSNRSACHTHLSLR